MVFTLHAPHLKHRITQVYLAQALNAISHSLIGIFIPIYLLTLGYSIQQAFVFFIVSKVVVILCAPLAAWLNHTIGFKKATLIHLPFFILSFTSLYALTLYNTHFLVPAVFSGIAIALYWIPIHTLFIKYSHPNKRSSEVGTLQALQSVLRVATPAIGGLIAAYMGFPLLILIALCLGTLTVVPLFLTPEIKAKTTFRYRDLWSIKDNGFMGATVADGFVFAATSILFPLIIYTTLQTTTSVGFIESLGTLIFAAGSIIVGRKLVHADKMLKLGAVLFGLTLIVRPFLDSAWQFSLIIMIGAVVASLYRTSYNTLMVEYGIALKDKGEEFVVIREMYWNFGMVSILGLCIMLPWTWGFFFAAIALFVGAAGFSGKPIAA